LIPHLKFLMDYGTTKNINNYPYLENRLFVGVPLNTHFYLIMGEKNYV